MDIQLHVVTGAAGAGKSTFGKKLSADLSAAFLDSDTVSEAVVRAGMKAAGLDPTDRDSPEYKRIFRDAVYECLFATAAENLVHTSVVIVGPFTRELQDANWPQQLEAKFGIAPVIWHLNCDDETRRNRIAARGNPRDRLKLQDWPGHASNVDDKQPAFEVRSVSTDRQSSQRQGISPDITSEA